jgi:hypothetical protein
MVCRADDTAELDLPTAVRAGGLTSEPLATGGVGPAVRRSRSGTGSGREVARGRR